MKRWWLQLELRSIENYMDLLHREGWTWFELQHFRRDAEALRVRIALIRPMDREDAIAVTAALMALAALITLGVWQWLS